jgi:hypothetical protein
MILSSFFGDCFQNGVWTEIRAGIYSGLLIGFSDGDIADGGEASAAVYRIVADPTLSSEAYDRLRRPLLEYCQRDTLALARVHQWLIKES